MSSPGRRERKVITAVFADLVGFTSRADQLDPEDVEEVLRPYHERLRGEFEVFGGTVEKFIGDAVVAVFGAPIAHEDDPERAVRAAIAIRDAIREAGDLEVRIAVNTGEAIVRLDADTGSGEGIATGDVLNTASRLQTVAPVNGILVGEATYNATRDSIRYEPAEPVEAKGKRDKLPVWVALEARSRVGVEVRQARRIPLVGRERERTLLLDTLERVESELTPQLVTIVGVPGIGKSRLVDELLVEIERQPAIRNWRPGRSLPYGQHVSFWSLTEMVKAQAGILEDDEPAVVGEKLAETVRNLVGDEETAWVESRLRPLVGLDNEADAGDERRGESFAAWRRFFEGVAEHRTTVLIFEDIHWADDGLLDFIDHLVDWASDVAILVICTTRPELLERRPGWGGGKMNSLTLALSPLSENESARFISLVLDRSVLTLETQQALLERAGGNPLYAEQYARLYAERGSVDDIQMPENVQGLIAARLDALSSEEKALLQDAAVMGRTFWSATIGRDEARTEALHTLERKEFIRRMRRSSVAGEEEFVFRHVLVRDVAYGQIPRGDRVNKHLRAAEWIEGLGRPEDHAELLAYHYLAAIELSPVDLPETATARARRALRAAGDRAFALNSFGPAIGYYESALRSTPEDDPARPRLLFLVGRANYRGNGGGAEALTAAVPALIAQGDLATAAEAETLMSQSSWVHGDSDKGWRHMDRAVELVAGLPASREKAVVTAFHARNLQLSGRSAESFARGRETLEMAEEIGLDELRANALNTIALARRDLNQGDGYAEMRESIALTTALNSVEAMIDYNNLSEILRFDGRLPEAEEATIESGRVAQRFGAAALLRWHRFSLPYWSYARGDWDDALRRCDELIAEVESGTPHYMELVVREIRAMIRFARGDVDGAVADASAAVAKARQVGDPQALFPTIALNFYILVERGEMDEARTLLTESVEAQRAKPGLAFAQSAPAVWAARELGGLESYIAPFRQARRTPWLDAAEAVLAGDWAGAAEIYERIGTRPDEAFARLRSAEDLTRAGRRADAASQLQPALAFFTETRATRLTGQATALLASTA